MKLPLSWINEMIVLEMPPHQVAKTLTLAGLEVDGLISLPLRFENVVVGEVIAVSKHPEADKLTVATVSDGGNSYQVVCGAPNCRPGIKTALALIGATLQDEEGKIFKVKKTKLRGVESHGMLCSEKELGVGEDQQGIMEFADHLKPGADIAKIYGDTIFEISITPNLGHCASVRGIARELSAAIERPITPPSISIHENRSEPAEQAIKVIIQDFKKCPRYACRVIKGVKVGPSPEWLQKRLVACDLRPVNNVVDITNYVLMEFGHPLHAFDYDRIDAHQIVVRCAREGEGIVTLDGKQRILTEDDLLICDRTKPIAIAGVMGGLNSEVSYSTHHVVLEAAYFQPAGIRRTSKRLGLQTDASRRFERGSDPNGVVEALDRAAMLLEQIAGGTVCMGILDIQEHLIRPKQVPCRLSRINHVLGTKLSLSEVEGIFTRLEMKSVWDGKDLFLVTVPTYRVDVQNEIDLIEEVARIYGFENIPKRQARHPSSTLPHAPIFLFEREVRSRLIGEGLQECLTCDLIGPTLLEIVNESLMPQENIINVVNPTSIEQSVLRTSLLPGLLQVAKFNFDRECRDLSVFELGRVHFKENELYKEQSVAGILLMGKAGPHSWYDKPKEVDFFLLKGIIENLLQEMGIEDFSFKNTGKPIFHPGRQGSLYIQSAEVGVMGEVHPAIIRRLDVRQRILFAEIDLHVLFQIPRAEKKMEEVPMFPASDRDLTLTLREDTPIQEILDCIEAVKSRLLEKIIVFDLYRSEKIGKENKNATFRFIYRDRNKTVAQEAVDAEHARLTAQIESRIRR